MGKSLIFVLDASAILHGYPWRYKKNALFYIPKEIADELKKFGIDTSLLPGINIVDVDEKKVEKIVKKLKATGDILKLSDSDIKVITLAYDLKGKVVTDDYTIQNACSHLLIEFESMKMEGIKKKIEWSFKCTGCGKEYLEFRDDCKVCGHKLKLWKWRD